MQNRTDNKLFMEVWKQDIALSLSEGMGIFAKSVGYILPRDPQKGVIVSLPEKEIFKLVPTEEIKVDEGKGIATYQGVEVRLMHIKISEDRQGSVNRN